MQVAEQPGQMWNQHQTQPTMQKMPMQMPVKQPFFMPTQDPMKLFEHPMSMQPPQPSMDKKMKFPEVKMQDFYWEPPYHMGGEGRSGMVDRMGKRQPGVFCPDQENMPRGPSYEVSILCLLCLDSCSMLKTFRLRNECQAKYNVIIVYYPVTFYLVCILCIRADPE